MAGGCRGGLPALGAWLAPAGADHDHGNAAGYRESWGLELILLVHADGRRVERWVGEGTCWIVTDHISRATIELPPLDLALELDAAHAGTSREAAGATLRLRLPAAPAPARPVPPPA